MLFHKLKKKNLHSTEAHDLYMIPCGMEFSREFHFADCPFFCASQEQIFANLDFRFLTAGNKFFADLGQVLRRVIVYSTVGSSVNHNSHVPCRSRLYFGKRWTRFKFT